MIYSVELCLIIISVIKDHDLSFLFKRETVRPPSPPQLSLHFISSRHPPTLLHLPPPTNLSLASNSPFPPSNKPSPLSNTPSLAHRHSSRWISAHITVPSFSFLTHGLYCYPQLDKAFDTITAEARAGARKSVACEQSYPRSAT